MAGTVTIVHNEPAPSVGMFIATCVADDVDGTFPSTPLPAFEGRLLAIITDPGSPAPTTLYDVKLNDASGFDRLGGAGVDRSTSVTERAAVSNGYVSRREVVSLAITGNSVASAPTVVTIHYTEEA